MQIFIYLIIFISGCFFGSFFTLAVYRIPKKEDILFKHSYCPNCNHKLGFLDLFPIFSYLFLRGKCRYCKTKIRPRYFVLELLSGITFLLIAISLKNNIYDMTISNAFYLIGYFIYVAILFIISGIDKEYIKVEKSVIFVGFGFELLYIIYQCTLQVVDVYQYVIYLILFIFLLILSIISLKRNMKESYTVQILFLILYMIIFGGTIIFNLTAIITLLTIAFYKIINKKKKELPIAFYLCVSNIVVHIVTNFICNYIM